MSDEIKQTFTLEDMHTAFMIGVREGAENGYTAAGALTAAKRAYPVRRLRRVVAGRFDFRINDGMLEFACRNSNDWEAAPFGLDIEGVRALYELTHNRYEDVAP